MGAASVPVGLAARRSKLHANPAAPPSWARALTLARAFDQRSSAWLAPVMPGSSAMPHAHAAGAPVCVVGGTS